MNGFKKINRKLGTAIIYSAMILQRMILIGWFSCAKMLKMFNFFTAPFLAIIALIEKQISVLFFCYQCN